MLYYDELETCNPLGSKAKIHKLGEDKLICLVFNYAYSSAFYFSLGNLPPKLRSSLASIQLVARGGSRIF